MIKSCLLIAVVYTDLCKLICLFVYGVALVYGGSHVAGVVYTDLVKQGQAVVVKLQLNLSMKSLMMKMMKSRR